MKGIIPSDFVGEALPGETIVALTAEDVAALTPLVRELCEAFAEQIRETAVCRSSLDGEHFWVTSARVNGQACLKCGEPR